MRCPARLLLTVLLATALPLAGCGGDGNGGSGDAEIKAIATTTQVGDFVRAVGGDRVDVDQILEPNSDPHDYEPRPSDALAAGDADVVFRSGGDLDEWLDGLLSSAGGDARPVSLIDSVDTLEGGHDHHEDEAEHAEEEHGEADPHWWQDPRNAILAVARIRDQLIDADPAGRAVYTRNAARYTARLRRLDRRVAACIGRLEPEQRRLVTTHDALGYYAHRYGLEVVGALIPSLSSQAQPSSKDTAELVDQIERLRVAAIFPESSLNPKLERSVARETGAKTGKPLWADTLGPPGSGGSTYVTSIESNTASIVDGLSGGEQRCEPGSR